MTLPDLPNTDLHNLLGDATHLVLDLDGTIVDNRERLYRSYVAACEFVDRAPLPLAAYVAARDRGQRLPDLLGDLAEKASKRWFEVIETPTMLALDQVFPSMSMLLDEAMTRRCVICIATRRRHRRPLMAQLEALGLTRYTDHVLSGLTDKAELVRPLLGHATQSRWLWIGDTDEDARAARGLGIDFIMVEHGRRVPPKEDDERHHHG